MRHAIRLSALFALLLTINLITSAQNPNWEAWMYNSMNGRMVLIGDNNAIYEDFTLPGLQGNDYSWRVMVSPDGQTIVYSLFNTFNQIHTVYAYSTATDNLIASYVIPSQQGQLVYDSIELNPSTQAFSPDGRSVAFGYTIENVWSLVVLDLFNQPGSILTQVSSNDAIMSGVERIAFDVPVVVYNDGTNIDFIIVPAGTEGFPNYPHYTYNIATATVTQNYYFTVPGGDFSQRDGSYVFPMSDFRLPNNNNSYTGFGQQINSIHLWIPNASETYPIYNMSDRTIYRVNFIQNSEKILMNTYDWVSSITDWQVTDQQRSTPTTILALQNVYPSGIVGVGDGFILSVNTNDVMNYFPELQGLPDRSALLYFDTRSANDGSASRYVWLSGENQDFKLVWARDNQLGSQPAPNPWTAIGQPANASNFASLTQSDGESSQAGSSLAIGGQARIFTTEGDRANMRSGPGTNFSVVAQLPNDAVVSVLEGPQTAGGFTWWRVQSGGNSGWVVESADGIRVLQPLAP